MDANTNSLPALAGGPGLRLKLTYFSCIYKKEGITVTIECLTVIIECIMVDDVIVSIVI